MPRKLLEHGIPASQLAQHIGAKLVGPDVRISGVCSLDENRPGELTFLKKLTSERLRRERPSWKVAAVLVPEGVDFQLEGDGPSLLVVKDPLAALIDLLPNFFSAHPAPTGISEKADIHPSAKIGKGVAICAFVWIGADAEIGDGVVIYPHVAIYPGVKIGAGSVIHSGATIREDCIIGRSSVVQNGAVIGGDGFGYIADPKLGLRQVPQIGTVLIADRVDIGANACIDRATLGQTTISAGAKLDNLVQIGHNCSVGEYSIICGQTGVAGSSTIGRQVVLGGNVGVADHITIHDGVRVGGKSGVTSHLIERGDYVGFPAVPAAAWRRQHQALKELPGMLRSLRKLVKREEGTDEKDQT